ILLRDKTAAERAKIKRDLINDLKVNLDLQVDTKALRDKIRTDLQSEKFKINVVVDKATATQAVQQALSQVKTWNGKYTADDLRAERGKTQQAIQQWKDAQAELARVKAAHVSARDAANAHASASISLGNAMGSNITIAGRLGATMASLYSVHAAKEFLSNVVEIGGELEHQKIAMDTIFGDKGKTLDLFGKIKDLARNSPFGVMELTKSVKALSAYGVQYNEIYETAKRLADISAATSVDINRLILAFGKTKSRTFLDGLEAKQFAYANIPIYDMLSKKLTELEGKFVSVKEVMGRIKKREIGFDMVKEVLWDLTDEGGKFYNMQEALAGSVKTSWKLVKDNIELMYGELAESLAGPLKGTAEILQKLTRNWETVAWVIGAAAIQLGVYRLAALSTNLILSKQTASTYQQIMADKKREAEMLRMDALHRKLNISELRKIATSNAITNAELKQAIVTEKLTQEEVMRLYALGKLNAKQLDWLIRQDLVNAELIKETLNCSLLTLRLKALGLAFTNAAKSAWAFLTNPWTIAMAAISGVVALWQKNSQEMEKAKELGDNMYTKATEGAKNLHEVLAQIGDDFSKISGLELQQSIEKMVNALKDYSPTPERVIANAQVDEKGNIRAADGYAKALKKEIECLEEAQKLQEKWNINDIITTAQSDAKGGWLDDGYLEDLEDMINAFKEADKRINNYIQNNPNLVKQYVDSLTESDANFAEATKGLTTYAAKFREMVYNVDNYATIGLAVADGDLRELFSMFNSQMYHDERSLAGQLLEYDPQQFKKAKREYTNELKDVIKSVRKTLDGLDVDFSEELDRPTQIVLETIANNLFEKMKDLPPVIQDQFREMFRESFNLDFDDTALIGNFREIFEKNMDDLPPELAEQIRTGTSWEKLHDASKDKVKKLMSVCSQQVKRDFPHLSTQIQQLLNDNAFYGKIILSLNRNALLDEWQQTMIEIWGSDSPEIVAAIRTAADVASAYTALAELRKETDEWLKKFGTIKLPVGFTYTPGQLFDEDKINELKDPVAKQMLKDANQCISLINNLTAGQSTSGVNLSDWEKNKKKDKGIKKDKFLENLKERFNVLKKAVEEYKKWSDLVSKEEATARIKESGIFSLLFPKDGAPANLDDYKGELQKLLDQIEKQATTKERREFVVTLRTLLNLDIPRDEKKEAIDELKNQLEAEIKDVSKRWNLYNQIINAGGSKLEASQTAFNVDAAPFKNEAQALADTVQKHLKAEGFDIPFSMSIEEATKILGATDNPLHKALLKAWTEAKDAMEKDEIEVKIKEITVINKYKSSAQKIDDLTEKYAPLTGLTADVLKTMPEANDKMSDAQIAYLTEYKEKVSELRGELLTLLPIWGQIFGDHTYQSYGQLNAAADIARQIVGNAQVQKNADGKPTIYTSSYKDATGKTINVSGQFSQLEKLKKAIDDLYKAALNKNPFQTLIHNISEVFKGSKGEMKDKSTMEKIAMIGESAADSAKMVGTFAGQMSEMFEAMGESGAAEAMDTVGQA
ncbi:MAG: hypothetical protein NC548_53075, partial [Lachnospiraceae bacterium]|nr:hypothetical protein [Lachnospiraceae bacterium]